ncbi:MAG TPA: ParB N-terminal domain-containing protein [Pirellulales bacterium]|jgi:hypothetical protein|nr:ParB N-terminal domain-containing protein [Pirellulales bacterium]
MDEPSPQTTTADDVADVELLLLNGDHTQTRDGLREQAVDEYADVLRNGGELPPITAYRDEGGTLLLSAGFHRVEAHKRAGRTTIRCRIFPGDRWAAVIGGIRDNRQHRAERLTNADRAASVQQVLQLKPSDSDGVIASLCGVSPRTVAKYRSSVQDAQSSTRVGQDGRVRNLPQRRGPVTPAQSESPVVGQPITAEAAAVAETAGQISQHTPGSIGLALDASEAAIKPEPRAERTEATPQAGDRPEPAAGDSDKVSANQASPDQATHDLKRKCNAALGLLSRHFDRLKSVDRHLWIEGNGLLTKFGRLLENRPVEENAIF